MQHIEVTIIGEQNHAGTTPMDRRRDAVMGFVALVHAVNEAFGTEAGPTTVWTFGRVNVIPNATSIVPGRVETMLQIRDPDQDRLDHLASRVSATARAVMRQGGLQIETRKVAMLPPAPMDPTLVTKMATSAERIVATRWRRMVSGALHDAVPVSRILPSAMLFVPSIGGKSHCFEEDTRPDNLVQGCTVLASLVGELLSS
jgi:N-carbamoyl-L-amino-acid hydrolase